MASSHALKNSRVSIKSEAKDESAKFVDLREADVEPPKKKHKMGVESFSNADSLMAFSVGEGDYEKRYIVRKRDARKSPVIKAILKDRDSEGWITHHFEETTDDAVKFLIQWLDSQKLDAIQLRNDDTDDGGGNDDIFAREDDALFDLWILAAKLGLPELQNVALKTVDAIIRKGNPLRWHNVPISCIKRLYSDESGTLLLRGYMVAACAEFVDFGNYQHDPFEFPHQFMMDLAAFWSKTSRAKLCKVADFYVKSN
ncbi:uncharacterized protein LY89DRAFT_728740 [Mollisia scopiformis]|uniref:Uncharacterized protein n=1 Tax=Mollisia scopiformis TaxID=149040 RepID=A0A194XR06_MOLSC|nr:uncharacterized protein LY89DRAFT_728740 [Mollisia scopiformis]KUJ22618.1 hypothetical protein LY89DRAFT_728740 [Mollisia scopiformis]